LTENDGHEIGGQDIYRLKIDYITPQKRACPHGTSVKPSCWPIRQTSLQLSDGVADDVALVTVAVSVADDAVPDGWSSASSSSLSDERSGVPRRCGSPPARIIAISGRLISTHLHTLRASFF